ncbi:MAG: polyhydroxyalkanoate granule-associated protein PhaF [Gemmatimonadetes bacterium]|nr:polyhydroxyalkanoate granule-associated protein PhaF [Gemmatimonadota bacterium]
MTTKTKNESIFRLGDLPRNVAGKVVSLPRELAKDVSARGRDVWLAGLGALATVEQEGASLFGSLVKQGEKLVERGEGVEKAGMVKIDEIKDDLEARRSEVAAKVETNVYEPLVDALRKLGVPTREEIRGLSGRVEALTSRVETLIRLVDAEVVESPARAVYTVEAREEGWAVVKAGSERAESRHPNKDEAVEAARTLAGGHKPSQLVILRKDGTVQDTVTYDA